VLRVGLTGGIGTGKSEVARLLAARGAVVVDSDALAREAVALGSDGLAEVITVFGPSVLAPDGSLDRAALAVLVFADRAARARLEAVVHPRVRALAEAATAAAGQDAVVVQDVPLLVEAGLAGDYDVVVVVTAPEETRVRRLVGQRAMSESDARARIAAQASDAQRLAVADLVVANDGTLAELEARVDEVWKELSARAGS
jgi:dephospho-CoA kinase